MSFENQQIIVKKIVQREQEKGHKGVWKIAYADFVTAMMAFFLLMWLLSATTERQRRGLSDYFSPSVSLSKVSTGGEGLLFGEESRENASRSNNEIAGNIEVSLPLERQLEQEIAEILLPVGDPDAVGQGLSNQIAVKRSDEGLVLELFDIEGYPLFWGESDRLTPRAALLVKALVKILQIKAKNIAIHGHLRSLPNAFEQIDAWNISLARAVAVQKALLADGVSERGIKRLTGYADRQHAAANPVSVRNNRIEIILLYENP